MKLHGSVNRKAAWSGLLFLTLLFAASESRAISFTHGDVRLRYNVSAEQGIPKGGEATYGQSSFSHTYGGKTKGESDFQGSATASASASGLNNWSLDNGVFVFQGRGSTTATATSISDYYGLLATFFAASETSTSIQFEEMDRMLDWTWSVTMRIGQEGAFSQLTYYKNDSGDTSTQRFNDPGTYRDSGTFYSSDLMDARSLPRFDLSGNTHIDGAVRAVDPIFYDQLVGRSNWSYQLRLSASVPGGGVLPDAYAGQAGFYSVSDAGTTLVLFSLALGFGALVRVRVYRASKGNRLY